MSAILSFASLIFPKAAPWAVQFAVNGIPWIIRIVKQIKEHSEAEENPTLTGAEKFSAAIDKVEVLVDEHLDGVPGWSEIPEESRDRIMAGLVELAHFFANKACVDTEVSASNLRSALRELKKAERKERKAERKAEQEAGD